MTASMGKVELFADATATVIVTEKMLAPAARPAQLDAGSGRSDLALSAKRGPVFRSGTHSEAVGENAAHKVECHPALVAWHGLAAHGALQHRAKRFDPWHKEHDTLRSKHPVNE